MVDLLNHHGCDKESILNDLKDLNVEDQFNENAYNKRRHEEEERLKQYREKNNYQNPPSANQPHCPTCGSTDIIKISAAKKTVGAGLFVKPLRVSLNVKIVVISGKLFYVRYKT